MVCYGIAHGWSLEFKERARAGALEDLAAFSCLKVLESENRYKVQHTGLGY